jgi:type II secretory pathway component GspD/PulD (secretin)
MKPTVALLCLALSIAAAQPAPGRPLDNSERLTLELEGVPIATALKTIAQQNNLNLVISGEVQGTVTIRLDSVDIATALEAILAPNGYNYYIKNDVIVVKPLELNAIGERVSRVVTLKYLAPQTAQKALVPHKSPKGEVVILDKAAENKTGGEKYQANRIMITDLPEVVDQMEALIVQMDQPERLISIEVKIIETKVDTKSKLGFAWPTAINTSLGKSATDESTTDALDNAAGIYNLERGAWTWGTLTVAQLQNTLDILNQNDNSKLISDPHIITVENHEAEIAVETVIPIPTVSRFTEGAATQDILTFVDERVGISLKVTPRINENGRITLEVFPKVEDIIGYAGPTDNRKPITASRSIETTIAVNDGETAVLGGLLKEDVIKAESKVPLLGSIPILGKILFTNKSDEKSTTDLIILITPKIMP